MQQVLYDVSDRVATITLNRPEQLNAFTGTMMRELIAAFDRSDADDGVRAVIVPGPAGERHSAAAAATCHPPSQGCPAMAAAWWRCAFSRA
jgi:enoyl-CoA hydratase/carnithine racemase